MQNDIIFWLVATFAAIFVGLGKGGLPVVAALAVPSLSLFMSPIAAAGLLLPVYVVSDIFALIFYRKNFEYNVLKIGIFGMTIGVLIGWATAHVVIEWIVTLIIGLMGTLYALKLIFSKFINEKEERSLSRSKGIFWCTIAGFTSFISHNGGPPWQIFILPMRLSKSVYVGTSVIAFSYVNAIKIPPYFFLGQINLDTLQIAFYLIFPAALAVYLGYQLVRLISDKLFFIIVSWALLMISLKLIWDGLNSAF
ncbi:MAG: hypothetical protein CML37_03650 [Rhodobacteraceae bacterium]|nr:hypothetical protein [Paracoccaceae bacterium]